MIELRGNALRKKTINEILEFKKEYPLVKFNFILNEKNDESVSYVKMLEKFVVALGIDYKIISISSVEEGIRYVESCKDDRNNKILNYFDDILDENNKIDRNEEKIIERISPLQDPDMLTKENIGDLVFGDLNKLPGTAKSVISLLNNYEIDVKGKKALIIGRSISVGMPIFLALQRMGAFCSLAHSKVSVADIKKASLESDIIVLASGQRNLIGSEDISKKAIVIDCGYHSDGKGDIDFVPNCEYFTPVPGGVGPMTIASVIKSGYYLRTLKNDN